MHVKSTETNSQQEQKLEQLTTIKGLLGSVINDVEHFARMMASTLVDPVTYPIGSISKKLWEIFHSDFLSLESK